TQVRNAELVALEARRDVRVRSRVDVGVHTQAYTCSATCLRGDGREHIQLGFALDVEAHDASVECLAHFCPRLAHAREDDLGGIGAGSKCAIEFAAGHDVETATCLDEGLQYCEARIRLHCVADEVVSSTQCALVRSNGLQHRRLCINVQGCPVARGKVEKGTVSDMQRVAAIGDMR